MKKVLTIILMIAMFLLGACTVTDANAEQTYPLKIWKQNENGRYNTLYVVDENTGVNYVVVSAVHTGGHYGSVAITPRLNADGSLYVRNK